MERRKIIARQALYDRKTLKQLQLNKTIGTNRKLMVDIDIMRTEINFSQRSIKMLKDQIADLKKSSLAAAKVSGVQGRAADDMNN